MNLADADAVDAVMKSWRQGDCFVGRFDFVWVGSSDDIETSECRGFMVLTQTCDIVRSSAERSYLEVAALDLIADPQWSAVVAGHMPRYTTTLALHPHRLAADLDRIMTITKAFAMRATRTVGWTTDAEERSLRAALARKRGRPALPDDLVSVLEPLRKRWLKRHGKGSAEGQLLAALREIRVTASPSFDALSVRITVWLVCDDRDTMVLCQGMADAWEQELLVSERYEFDFRPILLQEMSARAYVDSDRLDFDHLSATTA